MRYRRSVKSLKDKDSKISVLSNTNVTSSKIFPDGEEMSNIVEISTNFKVVDAVTRDEALEVLSAEVEKLESVLEIINNYISYKPIIIKRLAVCKSTSDKLNKLQEQVTEVFNRDIVAIEKELEYTDYNSGVKRPESNISDFM
jgi:hypothetical protein